jgi:hypothetical protein
VEGLKKDQMTLLERAIDKFIIADRMCSKKYTTNNKDKSIYSDLRRKMDDHHRKKGWPPN